MRRLARLYRRPEAGIRAHRRNAARRLQAHGGPAPRLHSATNYECYKGLYSSFNSMNLFEIGHSLARQFGPEAWTLYKGLPLLSFAG